MLNSTECLKYMNSHIENSKIDKAKELAREFNQSQSQLCFTSRQIIGLRMLEEVIDLRDKIDEEQQDLISELIQIKYTIESSLLELKCEKYSQTLQGFRLQ